MPDKINKKYEAQHLARIKAAQEKIERRYQKAIEKIYKKASGLQIKGDNFKIADYPILSSEIDKVLSTFQKEIIFTLQNGIKDEWQLSINKNADIIHKRYGEKNVSATVNKMIYDPQAAALEQFNNRVIAGLKLSDRVHKYTNQFRREIEQNLFVGVRDGVSAAQMARDHKQYLDKPDMLFRRVRNAKGNLVLSKKAKEYKPGKGVYRSSCKNALRLTRDTINDSYRQSDMVRYSALPFIIGFDVNLSNRHPMNDICDDLKGTYPKTFVWLKWHNQCLCNCTSKLASPDEYAKYEQALLKGTEANFKFKDQVTRLPSNFNEYVENNKGKMDNWVRKPEWVTENGIKL